MMTAQKPGSQKPRSRWGLPCGLLLGAAILLVLAAVAVILWQMSRGRAPLTVSISLPESGERAEVNQPVAVSAMASSRTGPGRVEVYADGALILAQDSTGQGETQLVLAGNWMPPTTGRHVLMARGYGTGAAFADSEIVFVDVREAPESVVIDVDSLPREPGAPNPSLDVIASYLGTTPQELSGRNPNLGGTSPSAPLPPGSRVEGPRPPTSPRSGSSPPEPRAGTPAAPTGLSATADCTTAVVVWSASPGAQTYRVYRFGTTVSDRTRVADGLRGTNLRDTLPGLGTFGYQVASVRDGLEGPSAVVYARTPATCPVPEAPPGTAPDLMLTVAMVETDAVWDGLYCYLTVNSQPEERIPAGDFQYVTPDASLGRYYDLTALPSGGRISLNHQPLTSPVTLGKKCLGRTGWRTEDLGTFSASHPQAEWDGTLRTADGGQYRFSYCIGPSSVPCHPDIPSILPPPGSFEVIVPWMGFYIPPPFNVQRRPGWEACADFPNDLDRLTCGGQQYVACSQGRCEPPMGIYWDWTGTATFPESFLTGFGLRRNVTEIATGRRWGEWIGNIDRRADGALRKRALENRFEFGCGLRVTYDVMAASRDGRSAFSEPYTFETPPCPASADMTVRFDILQVLGPVDLREEYGFIVPAADTDLELFGTIWAVGGVMPQQESMISWTNRVTLDEGAYSWSSLNMNYSAPIHSSSGPGHHVFRTRITADGQTLSFGVNLTERDTDWAGLSTVASLPWCVERMTLPARSVYEWSTLPATTYALEGGTDEGDCIVTVQVSGAPVR